MLKYLITLLFVVVFSVKSYNQNNNSTPVEVPPPPPKSVTVEEKTFDIETLENVEDEMEDENDEDFESTNDNSDSKENEFGNYNKKQVTEKNKKLEYNINSNDTIDINKIKLDKELKDLDNLADKLRKEDSIRIASIKKSKPEKYTPKQRVRFDGIEGLVKFLLWMVGVLAVCFVVYQVVKGGFSFNKKIIDTYEDEQYTEEEIISQNDVVIKDIVSQFEASKNWRMAVRYNFLEALKTLNEKNLINYAKNKTNFDYSFEINNQETREAFLKTLHPYEYVWYGNYIINEEQYFKIKEVFANLKNQI